MDKYRTVFIANLTRYMEAREITQSELANLLNVNKSVISSWLSGARYPRINTMEKIAALFHIEKSDLMEEKSIQISIPTFETSEHEKSMIKKYRQLSSDGQIDVDEYIDFRLQKEQSRLKESKETS